MALQMTSRPISERGNLAEAGIKVMVEQQQLSARSASRRVLRLLGCAVAAVVARGSSAAEPVLTSVSEIKLLTPQEAALARPVRLRGVITVWLGGRNGSFLQDETGGVFVAMRQGSTTFVRVGDWVECRGRTAAGGYAPMVELEQFEYLGRKEIPDPVPMSLGEFSAGRHDGEWVETRGIVRSVQPTPDARPEMQIALGQERLRVQIYDVRGKVPEHLVDSEVRLFGAASGYFNQDRQLLMPALRVSDWSQVIVTRPASGDPFASVLRSTTSLFRYAPDDRWDHRCKLKGVVTHYLPGKVLFLRDDDGALYVETTQSTPLKPGDVVEVAGFPAIGLGATYLQDSVYRVVGAAPAPGPVAATPALIVQGKIRPSELIAIEGVLVESTWLRDRWILTLKSAEHTFDADLERSPAGEHSTLPDRGSRLQLVGVVWTERVDPRSRNIVPESFRVLLRSMADIEVIEHASWWTDARLARTIATLLLVMVAALGWIWLLRRRVEAQTATIAEKVAREAVAEERARTACEIHDTVAQGFMALGFQLEALSSELRDAGPPVRQQLERTMKMLRHSHEEARHSLKQMRSQSQEAKGLSAALRETVERGIANFTPEHFRYHEKGTPFSLPELAEHNILRIAQEAATNAAKHASAGNLDVELSYEPDGTRLRIADDGCGFEQRKAADLSSGDHFGLQIMHERAQRIGASLQIRSQPGAGTEIILLLPRIARQRPSA
jgi:signal transduction histidine kinase